MKAVSIPCLRYGESSRLGGKPLLSVTYITAFAEKLGNTIESAESDSVKDNESK